jgi:hypothetical protein
MFAPGSAAFPLGHYVKRHAAIGRPALLLDAVQQWNLSTET